MGCLRAVGFAVASGVALLGCDGGPAQETVTEAARPLGAAECLALTSLRVGLLSYQPGPDVDLLDRYRDELEDAAAAVDNELPGEVSDWVDDVGTFARRRRANMVAKDLLNRLSNDGEELRGKYCGRNYLGEFGSSSSDNDRV